MSNFKIGEKVVCVNSFELTEFDVEQGIKIPIKNNIYAIRTIDFIGNKVYIRLEEIINPILDYKEGFSECQFNILKFRKLDHAFGEKICAEILESVKVKEEQLN